MSEGFAFACWMRAQIPGNQLIPAKWFIYWLMAPEEDWMDAACLLCGHRLGDHKAMAEWAGKGCPETVSGERNG